MSSTSALQVMYPGDAVIRGLARLPTMMSATDIQQGAGRDTNAADGLHVATTNFNEFVSTPSGSRSPAPGSVGTAETTGNSGGVDWGKVGEGIVNGLTGGNSSGGDDAANADSSGGDTGGCADVSFLAHPVVALNCLLDRTLFGLVALVLIGFGLYLFAMPEK